MYCPNPSCPNLREVGVPAEFKDGISDCSECGHLLEYGDAPPPSERAGDQPGPEGWTKVGVYDSPAAAHGAKGLLESAGIAARVVNEHLAGLLSTASPAFGEAELYVPDRDREQALALIRDFSMSRSELPLEDDYEIDDDYEADDALERWSTGDNNNDDDGLSWTGLAALILLTLALYQLWGEYGPSQLKGSMYDRGEVSRFVVIHLSHEIDHLEKSEIELILDLDLEYLGTLDLPGGEDDVLGLDLDDAARFIHEVARERDHRLHRAEIVGVLELRNRYLVSGTA